MLEKTQITRVKIVKMRQVQNEDVYDLTIRDNHNFFANGLLVHNCAEQSLADKETCCLAEVYLPNIKNYEELKEVLTYAYRMCKHSLALHCSLKETEKIVNKNMRMGIGMTGILQATEEQRSWLKEAYVWLRGYDKWYSGENNFPESVKLTTVKPSGCMIPQTKIKTNLGELSFEQIFELNGIDLSEKINEHREWYNMDADLYAIDKNGDQKRITKLFVNGIEDTIKLTFDDGYKIECTPNHKFLLKSGEWKQAKDLLESDELEDRFYCS